MDLTEYGRYGQDGRNRNLALHPSPDQKQNSEQNMGKAGQLQLRWRSSLRGRAGNLMMMAWLFSFFFESSFVCVCVCELRISERGAEEMRGCIIFPLIMSLGWAGLSWLAAFCVEIHIKWQTEIDTRCFLSFASHRDLSFALLKGRSNACYAKEAYEVLCKVSSFHGRVLHSHPAGSACSLKSSKQCKVILPHSHPWSQLCSSFET